jgi:hypothetical protein
LISNNNQQPKETNQGPGLITLAQRKMNAGQWTHNPKLGYKSTQGLMAKQSALDEDMDMTGGDKEREGENGTEQEEAEKEKEWAVEEHHRDTSLAVKVAFDDLKGSMTGHCTDRRPTSTSSVLKTWRRQWAP